MVGQDGRLLGDVEAEGDRPRVAVSDRRLAPGGECDLRGVRVAVDVPLGRRGRVAGMTIGPAHQHPAAEELRQGRLAQEGEGEVGQRAAGHKGDLARPAACLLDDQINGMALAQGPAGWRQLGMAEALRTVCLGRRLERLEERPVAPEGDLDIGPSGELEHRAGVPLDLVRVDVAADAGDRDQLRLGARDGIQERQRIVDPGVDVEDQRNGDHRATVAHPWAGRVFAGVARRPSDRQRPAAVDDDPDQRAGRHIVVITRCSSTVRNDPTGSNPTDW